MTSIIIPLEELVQRRICKTMDIFQEIDFSQLLLDTSVSSMNVNPSSSGCDDILDLNYTDYNQDIKVPPLSSEMKSTPSVEKSCELVSKVEKKPASSSLNYTDYYQDIKSSPLWNEMKSTSCVEKSSELVSKVEKKPASSDSNGKKKTMDYRCSVCDKSFSTNSNLNRHMRNHEKKPTVFACALCDKTFPRDCYLNQHILTHGKEKLTGKPEFFECSTCSKPFSCKSYLKKHMKIHTREKLISCEVCFRTFSTKPILRRHQLLHSTVENGKSSFKCEHCAFVYTRKDQLNQHTRHYQNSTYLCIKCNQKFCRWKNLKAHIREYHVVQSKLAQKSKRNPYCKKTKYFKRKNELCECSTTTFENGKDFNLDIHEYLNSLKSSVENELKFQFFEKQNFKSSFQLEAIVDSENESEFYTLYLNSNSFLIISEEIITHHIEQVFAEIIEQYSKYNPQLKLRKIVKLDIFSVKLNSV